MTEFEPGEEFTELVDANLPRVDLVGKGANGLPFLVAKSADGGLLPAEFVRGLVAKSTDPEPAKDHVVSLTGSPAAIAAMIHNAPIRKTEKENAVSDTVTKDDGAPDAALEVGDIIAEAPGGSTAESVPGSPDWEELDAATAESAIGVLGRAKAAIDWLVTREQTEAVTTDDGGDLDNAFDLSDACGALDYAIRTLGAFAAGEKLEAGLADELEAVSKAAASVAEPLDVLERLAPVAKAGRVLSTANEARIKSASDSLAEVLATLPTPIEDGLQVAKSEEETVTEPTATDVAKIAHDAAAAAREGSAELADSVAKIAAAAEEDLSPELAAAIASVEKAKGDPMVICYNAAGKAIGLIDPEKLQPIADDATAATSDDKPADEPAPADAPAVPAPAPTPAPAPAPAPAATATVPTGTPATAEDDQVTKSEPTASQPDLVAKAVADAIEAALEDHPVVKALKDRVATLEAPVQSRVARNGVIPSGLTAVTRGPAETTTDATVAKAEELREQLANANTPAERERIQKAMQAGAAQVLADLHKTRPHPAR